MQYITCKYLFNNTNIGINKKITGVNKWVEYNPYVYIS